MGLAGLAPELQGQDAVRGRGKLLGEDDETLLLRPDQAIEVQRK